VRNYYFPSFSQNKPRTLRCRVQGRTSGGAWASEPRKNDLILCQQSLMDVQRRIWKRVNCGPTRKFSSIGGFGRTAHKKLVKLQSIKPPQTNKTFLSQFLLANKMTK
jgi:hypothetical protein